MLLLDLPPEILDHIIHFFVCTAGYVPAAQARYVCRTFASAIIDDLLRKQPLGRPRRTKKESTALKQISLLDTHMASILTRMNPKSVANDYLFRYMHAAADFLMRFSDDKTSAQHDLYRCYIAGTISFGITALRLQDYLWGELSKHRVIVDTTDLENSDPEGLLAAAAAVGSVRAVQHLLSRIVGPLGSGPLKSSELMGSALVAAATSDQLDVASLLYKHPGDRDTAVDHVWKAVKACMNLDEGPFVPQLLQWLRDLSDNRPDSREKRDLRVWAIETGSVETLQALKTLWGTSPNTGFHSPDFHRACMFGQTPVIKYFTEADKAARPHQTKRRTLHLTDGLRTIKHGWLVAAKYLVSVGAKVNSPYDKQCMSVGTALDAAIWHNHVSIVRMLLDKGAKVQGAKGDSDCEVTLSCAREQGGEMARLISKAVGQFWDNAVPEQDSLQFSRVDDGITAITDDMRSLHLSGRR